MNSASDHAVPRAILVLTVLALAACESKTTAGSPETKTTAAPEASVTVVVGDHGFQPSSVVLGSDRRIVFRRTSEHTCATAVVFPDLHIEKPLPLNTDVEVVLPASAHGELTFQCGMAMYKSKVLVP